MSVDSQIKEVLQATQADVRQRWNELAQESRQWVVEQVEQLNEQAQQLQAQLRQLRKALRREARQRRKLLMQLQKSGMDFGKDLLKHGSELTQNLKDFGGKTTSDLAVRSGELTQGLTKRSGKVTDELARRRERLLEPVQKRDRRFWTVVGFGVGLAAAGVVTYQLVRRRMAQQVSEQDEHIELPQNDSWNGPVGRPAGEIRHIDQGGTSVATLEIVDVETLERPSDAAFVGVINTKLYYPVDTAIDPNDLVVYFTTEDEARTEGFTAAK